MSARPLALVLAALLVGCAKKGVVKEPADPPPSWATEKGRQKAVMELAQVLVDGGSAEAALALVSQLRAEGVKGEEIDLLQGEALRRIGLADDAEAMLGEVVARHPRNAEAHNQLGILMLDRQDTLAALQHFEAAHDAAPDHAEYANNLGFTLLAAGRPTDAVLALREALQLDPTSPLTRNNLGFALIADGRDKEAYRVFRVGNSEADARYNLGLGLELRGATNDAARQYGLALSVDPAHTRANEALARLQVSTESNPQESP